MISPRMSNGAQLQTRPGRAGPALRRLRLTPFCVFVLPLLLFCCGCPFSPQSTTDGDGNSTVPDTTAASLDTATALSLSSADDERQFTGSITGSTDIDVYNLGVLSPGDRLFVDVQRTSLNLDPVAAIFDSRTYLLAFNDDRMPDGSDLNPQLDIVIPGRQDTYYLAIAAYPEDNTTGNYRAVVRVQRQVGVQTPKGQIVYLEWRGGTGIIVKNVGLFDLPPFSATDVGLPVDQTAALKKRVKEVVADRYAGLNLTLVSSDDQTPPAGAHSTIYFGGTDYEAFAISEQVDTFNADQTDDSIVFTGSYVNVFSTQPTFEQMAQALGNTVAHELAHLLGLVHTHDCNDLMDTTCFNDRLLSAQYFSTAALDSSVFPFGYQDSPEILGWVLGAGSF